MLKKLKSTLILTTLSKIHKLLNARQKRFGMLLVLGVVVNAGLDVFGLVAIIPVVIMVLDTEFIHNNEVISSIYEGLGFTDERFFILALMLGLLGFFLVKNSLGLVIMYVQAKFARHVALNLSQRQFLNYFSKDLAFFKSNTTGNLITNMMGVPVYFTTGAVLSIITICSELFVFTLILVSVAAYSIKELGNINMMLVLAAILIPAFLIIYLATNRKNIELGAIKKKDTPMVYGELLQSILAFAEIKLANKETYFMKRYSDTLFRLYQSFTLPFVLNQVPMKAMELLMVLGIVIILTWSLFVVGDTEGLGPFLGFLVVAAFRVIPSLNRVLTAIMNLRKSQYTLEILEDLETLQTAELPKDIYRIPFEKSIRFNHIHYTFPDETKPFLQDVDLEMQKGEIVGFIGASGSGKTTLMNLFLRFLTENDGSLQVDGKDLEATDTDSWRAMIGYVKQDVFILDTNVRENIAFGMTEEEIDEEKLNFAIENASLRPFVEALPQKTYEKIGEMGSRISGGQKQRIGIARALYKDAEIIVMDEATSALDPKTESEITETIRQLKTVHKTVLIIAHRVSTLRYCDRIFEMRKGKIVGEVSYDKVVQKADAFLGKQDA